MGSFALVGKQVIGPPQVHKLLENLVDTTLGAEELAHALDGYTNGYYTIRAAAAPGTQTAAAHEFCTAPLHPGPCKGWKKKLSDGTGPAKAPAAPAKAKSKASPKAAKPQVKAPPKASTSPAGRLSDQHIQAMPDDELFDLFAALSKEDQLDEPLMRRLIADMDRREQGAGGPAGPELTPEQKRVDELVAKGRDFLSAYAEVHGEDEEKLRGEAGAGTLDRRPGETKAAAVRRSYDEFTHLKYLQAEKATRGNMLNRAGKAAGIDPLTLFTGPVSRARRYASEELARWWASGGNERMTLTQFRAQVLGGAKDRAEADKTRKLSNARDFI